MLSFLFSFINTFNPSLPVAIRTGRFRFQFLRRLLLVGSVDVSQSLESSQRRLQLTSRLHAPRVQITPCLEESNVSGPSSRLRVRQASPVPV